MLPFRLTPAFKDYLWGGTRIKTLYHKPTDLDIVAESWELSAHPDGSSMIATGELRGTSFAAFTRRFPALLGSRNSGDGEFPILIKLIDARSSLSIQVHPDDAYARRVGQERGKTELWYILDCEPGAFLYFGFEHEITREEMRRRIEDNTIVEVLHKATVRPGDVFFISAGTIHAIGAGILLAEIQQNSNTTYRVYDFGRLGANGKPRELHVEKALEAAYLTPAAAEAPGACDLESCADYGSRRLAACPYFTVESVRLTGTFRRIMDGGSFVSVLCAGGSASLDCAGLSLSVERGDSLFVPADQTEFSLNGTGEFLITTLT